MKCSWCGSELIKKAIQFNHVGQSSNTAELTCDNDSCPKEYVNSRGITADSQNHSAQLVDITEEN